jgi:stage II sporulation SpoAA-like protein
MVLSKCFEPPDLLTVTLTGVMNSRDQAELVGWIRDWIRTNGPVRVLVRLTEFGGWLLDDASHDDPTQWLQDHEAVSSMAFVGDPTQRLGVLTAIAQPIRLIPIEYFGREADARAWLGLNSECI